MYDLVSRALSSKNASELAVKVRHVELKNNVSSYSCDGVESVVLKANDITRN
jgi:hypothetical protein